MNSRSPQLSESELARLAELAEKLRNHAILDAEVAELELMLAEVPGAREAFADLAMLTAELHHLQGRLVLPEIPVESGEVRQRFWRWGTVTALAACIAFVSLLTWKTLLPSSGRPDQRALPGTGATPAPSAFGPAGEVVARVTRSSGAVLFARGLAVTANDGDPLRAGSYELRVGLMEAAYPSGVEFLIESPATFELSGTNAVRLSQGKLSAQVPNNAVGFTVHTPAASVVDLGTEFGVSAGKAGSEVYVFKGEVLVTTTNDPVPVHLKENQASRIDQATLTPTGIEPQPQMFIRSLNEPAGGYVNQVLQLDPVAYFRMGPAHDPTLLRERAHQRNGRIILGRSSTPWGPGKLGMALRLGGAEAGTYAVMPNFPKATNNQLSVCAWVLAESRPRWASIAKNWAKDVGTNYGGQFHFGLRQDQGDLEVHVHDAAGQEVWVREEAPLPLSQWQFVAFTLDGATLRLYRNGREVGSASCQGLSTFAPPALGIGVKLDRTGNQPERNTPGFWNGLIDELAVFHHALPPSQILRLYQGARDILAAP